MSGSFMDEIRKIPPVTRFLCASSLSVSVSSMMHLVSPYKIVFVKELVTKKWEVWRVWSSFFFGSSGISYIFEFMMLYRNSNDIESNHFSNRSADYAWQLMLACGAILALNIPLGSFIHSRPLLLCLAYLSSALAPPGAQTSLFGMVTVPIKYFPYVLLGFDFLTGGPSAVATSITGAVVGHLWWWTIFGPDGRGLPGLAAWGRAPGWVRLIVSDGPQVPGANLRGTGVHVQQPRNRAAGGGGAAAGGGGGGYNWGRGNRLGAE